MNPLKIYSEEDFETLLRYFYLEGWNDCYHGYEEGDINAIKEKYFQQTLNEYKLKTK